MTLCPPLRRLCADHRRWLELIEREGPRGGADRILALWETEVRPHCRVEDEVLLPELARRLSEADALVVFTLSDHTLLRHLARALRDATGPERAGAAERLANRLAEHVAYEETTLFPALQQALGCARLAELAAELATAAGATTSNEAPTPKGRKP